MKRILCQLTAMFLSLTFFVSPSYAWWEAGHMLVANIAYQHLNEKAKKEVNHLLHYFYIENTKEHNYSYNKQQPNHTLMAMALWPDQIQAAPNYKRIGKSWHYISLPFSADGTPTSSFVARENVVWVIDELIKQLSFKQGNNYERARALAYLVHFVGDVHQPLHNGELYSLTFPHGDIGGNAYKISYQEPDGTMLTNLHALWDSGLRLFPTKGYPHDVSKPQDIDELSTIIMNDYPISSFSGSIEHTTPKQWSNESHQIAITAHNIGLGAMPSKPYLDANSIIAEKRIALAAYRLADTLNKLAGT